MEPKDFAMREAEQMDYAYRLPLYSSMELFIETLTGTCFELRVSPYDNVISVKAKIQRLEGIPISQQYLIWQNVELEDDYCLHDYNITDGCTLKLVLAMRGGPINTRRIAMEDPGFCEMADYIDNSREELLEKLTPPPSGGNGSKQVTLLVYRDGDQLNFFRVVDRGDGTLTPFSESLSGSACNLRDGEEDDDDTLSSGGHGRKSSSQLPLSVAQMVENNITAAKMKQIRSQMQNMHLNNSANIKKTTKISTPKKTLPIFKRDVKLSSRPASANSKTKAEPLDSTDVVMSSTLSDNKKTSDVLPTAQAEPGTEPELSEPTLSKAAMKRGLLKRMQRVEGSTEVLPEVTNPPMVEKLTINDDKEKTEIIPPIAGKPKEASEVEKSIKSNSVTSEPDGGRLSPRTRRLLNALESNTTSRRISLPTQTTAYRSPRSTMLQGMTFNRHDMYLRSYGLIPSPDDANDDRIASSASGESPPPVVSEDSESTKVMETTHGVKYSAFPSKPSFLGPGNRLLKTPPNWITSKDSVVRSKQAGASWHPAFQPPFSGDAVRGGERILRQPSTSKPNMSSKTYHKKSYFENMVGRNSRNFNVNRDSDENATPRQWHKLDSLHLPQPPSTSSAVPVPPWQKQRLRRLVKPPLEDALELANPSPDKPTSQETILNNRRSYGQTSKSGLRMKESPHGKVESMSREEAREVVDLINKAMDASILRTLVRSPVKETKRGNSGQNGHRLVGNNIQTPLSGLKGNGKLPGPPTLPPVKPTTKKKRCFLCAKRTGLASSYLCRCGNNFCAAHRYAESHNCTYDYKSSGRKLLEEANPLVSAPKLPKI